MLSHAAQAVRAQRRLQGAPVCLQAAGHVLSGRLGAFWQRSTDLSSRVLACRARPPTGTVTAFHTGRESCRSRSASRWSAGRRRRRLGAACALCQWARRRANSDGPIGAHACQSRIRNPATPIEFHSVQGHRSRRCRSVPASGVCCPCSASLEGYHLASARHGRPRRLSLPTAQPRLSVRCVAEPLRADRWERMGTCSKTKSSAQGSRTQPAG